MPAWLSVISRICPLLLSLRGLAASGGASPGAPRSSLLVSATYTLPVLGFASKSSGRSILVAPALSAANRVNTAASCAVTPDTRDSACPYGPERSSGSHVPVPLKDPLAGSLPEPSISAGGMSLASFATYSVPSSSSVMLCASAAGSPCSHRLHLLARDELVHVVEAFVVAAVGHDGVVVGDVDVGGLMPEPAHRGVLDRGRVGIPRVEFDDVAEPIGLIGCLADVEARVEGLPHQGGRLQRNAVAVVAVGVDRVGLRGALDGTEVLLEVLLAGKHCAPRGDATRAVGEGARDRAAGRVGGGLDEVGACARARSSVIGVSAVMRRLYRPITGLESAAGRRARPRRLPCRSRRSRRRTARGWARHPCSRGT